MNSQVIPNNNSGDAYSPTAKSKRQSGVADVWKKLGFEDPQRPETQFMQPPGILALECMAFFAVAQQDLYNKVPQSTAQDH